MEAHQCIFFWVKGHAYDPVCRSSKPSNRKTIVDKCIMCVYVCNRKKTMREREMDNTSNKNALK